MSVVAAMVLPDRIEIAADSIITMGWTQRKDFAKLIRNDKAGIIVGTAGSAEELNLFRLFLSTHYPKSPDELDLCQFYADFVSYCREWTGDSAYKVDNQFLIIVEERLFSLVSWYCQEIFDFAAIGAGQDFALAAMHLGHYPKDAVEVASHLSAFCELPVIEFTRMKGLRDLETT